MGDLIDDLHDIADEMSAEEYSEDAERIRDAIAEIERLSKSADGSRVGAENDPHADKPSGTAARLIQRLEDATPGSLFHCDADREEAIEIAAEEIAAAIGALVGAGADLSKASA